MKPCAALLVLTLLLGSWERSPASSPSESAEAWVDALYSNPRDEAHYPSERAATLATPELASLLRQAVAARKAHEKKFPDEKPPFADYPLLLVGPDAPERHRIFTSSGTATDSGSTRVIVELIYPAADNVQPDYVVLDLLPEGSEWKITRIRHLPSTDKPQDLAARIREDLAAEADSQSAP